MSSSIESSTGLQHALDGADHDREPAGNSEHHRHKKHKKDKDRKKSSSKSKSKSKHKRKSSHSSKHKRSKSSTHDSHSDSDSELSRASSDSEAQHNSEKSAAASVMPGIEQPVMLESAESITSAPRSDWMQIDPDHDLFGLAAPKAVRKSQKQLEKEADEERRLAIRKERELNPSFFGDGTASATSRDQQDQRESTAETPSAPKRTITFGDRGATWRMMKLKGVFEMAKEEGRSIDDVAMERYGSVEAFQEALDERAFLDKAKGIKTSDSMGSYRPSVRSTSGFKVPGQAQSSRSHDQHRDTVRQNTADARKQHTVIPSAIVPVVPGLQSEYQQPVMTKDELNKLNAQVIKARVTRQPSLKALEEQYAREKARYDAHISGSASQQSGTVVLPTIDERGRLLDLGNGSSSTSAGNKRKIDRDTHDSRGNRIRYSKSEESESLASLVLQEKTATGASFDQDFADRIARDATFKDSVDYLDESVDKLSRKKDTSDDRKRQIAINNFRKSQDAINKCSFCFQDGQRPRASIISLGVKAYLAMPETIEMVPGHCLIVPVQHVLTTLELEDDTWDEIRNFQKCLLQMASTTKQGYIFMEQVINFQWHKHTVIECIPVPRDIHEDAPGYFKEAINSSEGEWSQHRKIIVTDKGFRRSMVKNLPYFHVWFDPNRGYGHVIEDPGEWQQCSGLFSGSIRVSQSTIDDLRKSSSAPADNMYTWTRLRLLAFLPQKREINAVTSATLIPPTGISVISDIDDTIKDSSVFAGARVAAQAAFVDEAKAVPGMADSYNLLNAKGVAIHYVSAGPYQLYPAISLFLRSSYFPEGSVTLRNMLEYASTRAYKKDMVLRIIQDFPNRDFILIGDSGEKDIEIYSNVIKALTTPPTVGTSTDASTDTNKPEHNNNSSSKNSSRIIKVFIRNVTGDATKHQDLKTKADGFYGSDVGNKKWGFFVDPIAIVADEVVMSAVMMSPKQFATRPDISIPASDDFELSKAG
eukprot:jgi/Hompol1/817/HPOL_002430-RA